MAIAPQEIEGQTAIDEWITAGPDEDRPRRPRSSRLGMTVSHYALKDESEIYKAYLWVGAQNYFLDYGAAYVLVQYRENPAGGLPLALRLVGLPERTEERALKIRKDGGLVGTLWRRLGFTSGPPVRIDLQPETGTPILVGELSTD